MQAQPRGIDCRQRGLDARPEERRPVGTVKRVGPWTRRLARRASGPAAYRRRRQPEGHERGRWKIRSGRRRGFENHEYEARTIRENDEWHVYARQ